MAFSKRVCISTFDLSHINRHRASKVESAQAETISKSLLNFKIKTLTKPQEFDQTSTSKSKTLMVLSNPAFGPNSCHQTTSQQWVTFFNNQSHSSKVSKTLLYKQAVENQSCQFQSLSKMFQRTGSTSSVFH